MPHWCPCHIGADSSYWSSLEEKSCPSPRLQWMARGTEKPHTAAVPFHPLLPKICLSLHRDMMGAPYLFQLFENGNCCVPYRKVVLPLFLEKSGSCSGFYWHFLPRKPLHEHACVCSSQLLEEWTWEGFILPSGSRKVESFMVGKAIHQPGRHGSRSWKLIFSPAHNKQMRQGCHAIKLQHPQCSDAVSLARLHLTMVL